MAARDSNNTTNSYLRGNDGVVTNLSGYVLPTNATIIGIGAATDGAATWTAEVRKNGAATVIASLSLTAVAKDSRYDLDVDVSTDDEIQMYCNGTNISSPNMTVYLKRR